MRPSSISGSRVGHPPGGRATRHRARKGEGELLRDEILDAAEQLLAERGSVDAVSMRAVAARVGVTAPALYLHFADKDELFFSCCSRRFEEMAERLQAAAAGPGTIPERLRSIGEAYVRFGLERAEQYQVLFLGAPPHDLTEADLAELPGMRALGLVAELVAEGIASGVLRPELDPVATAVSLWAAVHGIVLIILDKREHDILPLPDERVIIEHVLDIALRGLVAAPRRT
ncbi:MAG: TetR/AcrR family transcriptional regulator [Acidimicrobiia bacterium]